MTDTQNKIKNMKRLTEREDSIKLIDVQMISCEIIMVCIISGLITSNMAVLS